MASPIVVDGTTTFIPVNTKLYTGDITVQVPPLDLGGRLITVFDTGGQASPSKRILVTPISGASFDTGVPFYAIVTANGSLSFSQMTLSVYTIPQTIIGGNTNSLLTQITISTPHTILSTVASQSSMVIMNNLAVKNLFLGGAVYALGGFQPTVNNPYVTIDYLSAITVSTASISVGNVESGGGLQTLNIIASSVVVSSQYQSFTISARSNAYAVSTQIAGLVVNGMSLYSDKSNLFLGKYQLNSQIHTLVPAYNSSMKGLVSSLIVGPGVSTLSTNVGLISTIYNPNPGFSTLSTYNATRLPFINSFPTSTLFLNVKGSLSTTAAQTGLSSISSLISYGLSSLALPFTVSSLSTTISEGLSSVFEGTSISTLQFALQEGLSSVNQNFGIDDLTVKTKGILSTISTQSALMSTLSTTFGYGSNYVNIGLYTSSFYGAASTSFNRLRIENTLSSFSTAVEYAVSNVDYFRGLSSLSTTIGQGFQPIDLRLQVSTVSTAIAQGLSSVSTFALQLSSLSTVIVGQISTLFNPYISTLSNVISRGASTVMAGPGISSFNLLASTSFRNIGAFIGLSSLSTTFTLGISTVILGITPSSSIEFSTLYTSSISLLNTATNYGNILANSGEFTVNGHAINPPDNNFEGPSSISTYSLFVGSTFTSFNTLYPSSLTIINFLTTSSLLTETALTGSTITGTVNIKDSVTTSVNEIRAIAGPDLLINGKSVFITANPGLSSLSSVISFQLSSISTFVNTMDAISTGLSTLALTLPRICTLSTLFGVRYIVPDNISTGISTSDSFISTMRVSTLNVTNFSLWSTFASTVTTSTLVANIVNGYVINPPLTNSFFIASTVFASSISISSFSTTVQVSSISSLGLTFGTLNAQNIDANSFFASSINANTLYASSFFLRDRTATYSVNRPLEFSTFYPLYGSNGILVYNSTIYAGGPNTNLFSTFFSTNFLTVSTVQATTAVYTSTLQFTGKVQFDRLVVMQSTLTPYFYATEFGFYGNRTVNSNQYGGRLYRSADGISWSQVQPTPGCWVGRGGTDTDYEGSYYYKIAWNGTYLLAYDCGRSNLTQTATNYKNNNAISYDGGNTWSNVRRCADAVCLTEQVKIFWDGEKWFKFNVQSNAGTESVTTVSFDGIRWQNYTWNQTDAGSLSQLMGANVGNATSPIASVEYNGTTLIASGMGAFSSNFAFSDDMMNARALNQATNFGFVLGGSGGDFNIGANMWSDGYAWWIPNQANASYGSICRIYPYRSNVTGITPTDTGGYNRYGIGVGFASAFLGTNNGFISGGCYNGQMHIATVLVGAPAPLISSLSILYSYDGIFWFRNPSTQGPNANTYKPIYAMDKWLVNATGSFTTTPTGASIFYSYDGLNWAPTIGGPPTTCNASFNAFSGSGCGDIMFMSNIKPSLDFNGVRIYNQPSGFSWQNPVSREQNIVAFQSSIMLHNAVYLSMDTSPSSILNGSGICVGIRNVKPSTTLDLGPTATLTAERLVISSLYVLPYRLSSGFVMYPSTSAIGSLKTERFLPLSTFNFYVHGSTFMKSLAVNVPNPVTVLDISGANPLFRSQDGTSDATANAYLTNIGQQNMILGPGVQNNSTGMSIYYRANNVNYKKSYGGSNFFTGQHATLCLDLSGAIMSNVVSTVTVGDDGVEVFSYSTITTDYTGFLLSSADEGYISIPKQNTTLFGSNAINIIEALPKTRITTRDKDPAVFGVVTNNATTEFNSDGTWTLDSDPLWGTCLWGRVRVNSIGEGALWVTNINGNISNGDYLCSSEIPGYSRKQDEDGMYNYTVAKATMSCDFDLNSSNYKCEEISYNGSTYKRAFIGVTYHCG